MLHQNVTKTIKKHEFSKMELNKNTIYRIMFFNKI